MDVKYHTRRYMNEIFVYEYVMSPTSKSMSHMYMYMCVYMYTLHSPVRVHM